MPSIRPRRALPAGLLLLALGAAPAAAADLLPSPLTTVKGAPQGLGKLLFTPTTAAGGAANGAQIVDRRGKTVWYHQAPDGQQDADLRVQTLHGKRVLTFWEGKGLGGLADGTNYVYDHHDKLLAKVTAGEDVTTDGHEFLLNDDGTAWVLSYDAAVADATSVGGSDHQEVINGIVRKVDVRTGRVLFSWNSADRVPLTDSEQPLPAAADTPWDWFHVNAIHLDRDGQLLIDARNTWTAYKVDKRSGKVIWRLGGKRSSFRLRAAKGQTLNRAERPFAWQHDINGLGGGRYTVFDNESAGIANTGQDASAELDHSRVVTIKLNRRRKVATLVRAVDEPDGKLASSQGNGQPLPGGGRFVGWGNLNALSQFDRRGRLVFDARFPAGVNTYRAYLQPW